MPHDHHSDARPGYGGESAGPPADIDRRRLMQLMAASLALAGSGCNSGTRFGAPLLSRPVSNAAWADGKPVVYATSLALDGVGRGVLVKTIDSRPIKIEGNPLHPASLGASDAYMQAEILSLYDPQRSRSPLERGLQRSWAEANAMLSALVRDVAERNGRGLHVLTGATVSPTCARLLGGLRRRLPAARVHAHVPIDNESARAGAWLAFGRAVEVIHDLRQADTIVCLGADILGHGPLQTRYAADFAMRRAQGRQTGRMPLLIAAETTPGLTGARADRRLALSPHDVGLLARDIAAELEALPETRHRGGSMPGGSIAAALRASGPGAVVIAGHDQPAGVHAIAHAVNSKLGAVGRTVRYLEPALPELQGAESLAALMAAIDAGEVTHLVVIESNPAYSGPGDLDVAAHIARVPHSVHLGLYEDETARACRWHLPQRHVLESWGDTITFDGTAGLQQPATSPLVEALSPIELLAHLLRMPRDGMALVQQTWRARWTSDFEQRWPAALESGIVEGSASSPMEARLRDGWATSLPSNGAAPAGIAVHFTPDPSVWDGRYACNAWLQELPKPLSKQTWGNAARLAADTAARLGFKHGDVISITVGERAIEAPVEIARGQATDTVSLPLGYGRTTAGPVGSHVGFDAYRLRASESPWVLTGARLAATGRRQPLVTTQRHHSMEGRDIVRIVEADALQGMRGEPAPQRASLYPEHPYQSYAWGMSIDLDACFGCNACVIACQAENNVPVVGAREVAAGREMHWLRVDRYFVSEQDAGEACFQPVPCMQCEKAPCEVVCPVNATVHSSEGLNDMVYNRCIGTRTCSNNCPYKVRRFNWFDYAAMEPGKTGASLNPEVTVRPRGVMEKCTYCTQRISAARIEARMDGRAVRDEEILTACQQACPTRAIVFGDAGNANAAVSRAKQDPRNYALLGELNTRPRTTYLARVRSGRRTAG